MATERKRSWTISDLEKAVTTSTSLRQVLSLLKLSPAGGNYVQIKKYIKEYSLGTGHFKGQAWNRGLVGVGKPRINLKLILRKNSHFQSFKLKKRLIAGGFKPAKCEECGWAKTTKEGFLPLELHHVNGDPRDNRLINLVVLCPNCHSLKPNHRGRAKRKK